MPPTSLGILSYGGNRGGVLVATYSPVGGHNEWIAFDGTNLWLVQSYGDASAGIYKVSTSGVVLNSYSPSIGTNTLAAVYALVGGHNYLYVWSTTGTLYKIDIQGGGAGAVAASYSTGFASVAAMVFDGTYFWVVNGSTNAIYKYSTAGVLLNTYSIGSGAFSAIAYDGTNLWVIAYSSGTLYKVSMAGSLLNTYTISVTSIVSMAFDGTYLWANSNIGNLSKISTAGVLLNTYSVSSIADAQMVYGAGWLWVTGIGTLAQVST